MIRIYEYSDSKTMRKKMSLSSSEGMTLLEAMVYIALLGVILAVFAGVMFSELNAWGQARAARRVNDGGQLIMERLMAEANLARAVDRSASVLGAHPGVLQLDSVESATSTTPVTVRFWLDNTELKLQRGASTALSLTGSVLKVTELIFWHVTSTPSEAVRMQIRLSAPTGRFAEAKTFTTAAVLRGAY